MCVSVVTRNILNPDGLIQPEERGAAYNYIITENGKLYHAGQVGRKSNGEHVTESFKKQAEQTFKNIEIILEAVDKEFSDVNKVTTYFTDLGRDFDVYMDDIWPAYFNEPYPCHTALGVDRLSFEELTLEVEIELPV